MPVTYPVSPRLALRLRLELERSGISQSALAQRLGVSKATVSQLLNGKVTQSAHVPAVANALGVDWRQSIPVDDYERRWLAIARHFRSARGRVRFETLTRELETQARAEVLLAAERTAS